MRVAEAVGRTIAALGASHGFGVVGSGNYRVTEGFRAAGGQFVAARHENGAVMMADAYARITGAFALVTLHQGCGLTNALTAITEAAKSHTPLLVLTGDTAPGDRTSNFWIDQDAVVAGLGVISERVHSPATAIADTIRAVHRARSGPATVVLNLPLHLQDAELGEDPGSVRTTVLPLPPTAGREAVDALAALLEAAARPVFVAGRGARLAAEAIAQLGERCGALLTTSAVGRGMFAGDPWYLDAMGGFSTDTTARLIQDADLIVAFGAGLNRWTTRDGSLIQGATVVQVDVDPGAIGFHHPVDLGVTGDAGEVARALHAALPADGPHRYRTADVAYDIRTSSRWRDVPFDDESTGSEIDPRRLTLAIDRMLPADRTVTIDGGNFCAFPGMFFDVRQGGFVMPLAFQSIGLSLAAGIGAAVARPDRVSVVGVGDGGFMMSLTELDTAVRLKLPLLIVVYDDHAYGAEVHHFAADGGSMDTVTFPDTDLAAIARGFGCDGVVVRSEADLSAVDVWLRSGAPGPLLVDAKIRSFPSWVLAHSFALEAVSA